MQITIFGANGRVGRLVVAEALERNYSVTAFVHGDMAFSKNKNLRVIQGDIYNQSDVRGVLADSEAVISTLGSWGTPKKDILSSGMQNIIPAMQSMGIRKIISLTGAGCKSAQDTNSLTQFFNRLPLLIVAPKVLDDAEKHIELLERSNLEWTIVRSPVMNDKGKADKFKLVNKCPLPWAKINRQSVAIAMLDALENISHANHAPFIVRS